MRGILNARFLAVCAAVVAASISPSPNDSQASLVSPPMMGDANCSGAIEIGDAIATLAGSALGEPVPCSDQVDTNCDGTASAADVLPILHYAAGLPPQPSAGCSPVGAGGDVEFISHLPLGDDQNGDVWVSGDFAYVGTYCGSRGAKIIDVSDPIRM